jgi:hypothetical protein
MDRNRLRIHIILAFCLLSIHSLLFAQLSPGDLHKSHQDLEGIENCTKCHSQGKQLAPEKCLACHTLLKTQIDQNKGLHARPDYAKCDACHIEHQGRDFDLVYWKDGQDNFNHDLTGYKLEGAHRQLKCEKCHTEKNIENPQALLDKKKDLSKTFLGLSQNCLTCHRDEHRAQLANQCLNCHLYNAWKPAVNFNHDKARFVLTGSHKTVDCIKCHAEVNDNKYSDDPSFQKFTGLKFNKCQDCHEDAHKGRFGANCETCHNTTKWTNYASEKFDHDKTLFPLKGKHVHVKCELCHEPGQSLKIAKFSKCMDCHDDYHQGQFKSRAQKGACEECHSESGFTPAKFTLQQHNQGRYPLIGAHLAVPCIACHKKITIGRNAETLQFKFQSMRCVSCHNDPHRGEVNKYLNQISALTRNNGCEYCHEITGWSAVQFNHDQSKFKLVDRHKNVSCKGCHQEQAKDKMLHFQDIPQECNACHQDKHAGQFLQNGETSCKKCHTPAAWKQEIFNHDVDSRFKLTGGHQKVPCQDCHKSELINGERVTRYKPLDTKCASCHGTKI